jgi:hypothetical protein
LTIVLTKGTFPNKKMERNFEINSSRWRTYLWEHEFLREFLHHYWTWALLGLGLFSKCMFLLKKKRR